MRRIALLVSVVLLVSVGGVAVAEEVGPVYPWRAPWRDGLTVQQGDTIQLGALWFACTKGLASMATKQMVWQYFLDGQEIPTQFVWSRPVRNTDWPVDISTCVPHTDAAWGVFGQSPYMADEPGEHTLTVVLSYRHPIIDGGDLDGDGRPDRNGEGWDFSMSLIVVGE